MTPEEELEFLGRWETDGGKPLGILSTPGVAASAEPPTAEDLREAILSAIKIISES